MKLVTALVVVAFLVLVRRCITTFGRLCLSDVIVLVLENPLKICGSALHTPTTTCQLSRAIGLSSDTDPRIDYGSGGITLGLLSLCAIRAWCASKVQKNCELQTIR